MLALVPTFDGKRTIPSPEVTRIMLSLLQLTDSDKLLEIGTGSGIQTESWGQSGAEIHSIELEPWIDSTKVVGECVYLHSGDGRLGLPGEAPFTAIVATCGIEQIPREWTEQLADGGRLVAPVGEPKCQKLTLFRKIGGELVPERIGAYSRFQMLRQKPPQAEIKPRYKDRDASG